MKITVFTPTYNRAYILENLYRSLQRQSFRDFEWLIVDDGSSDNTKELVSMWQAEENYFPIRYFYKENGGKHRAINYGVERAEGELFFNVDSDDYLTDDALEKIAKWESELPHDEQFCGIAGNLGTAPNETPNTYFEKDYYDGSLLDRYNVVDGERAIVFYTEIQKKYLYPEFEGERFMTEAVTWNRMARDGYKMRFFNDIIWIYEYREDGLTKAGNAVFINNPQGHALWLREKAIFTGEKSLFKKMMMYYSYYCDHRHHLSVKAMADYIGAPRFLIRLMKLLRR